MNVAAVIIVVASVVVTVSVVLGVFVWAAKKDGEEFADRNEEEVSPRIDGISGAFESQPKREQIERLSVVRSPTTAFVQELR
jgi:hypothetical protein